MTLNEYLEELREMDKKSLKAYFDAPLPDEYKHTQNPWWNKKHEFLHASIFYCEMADTIDWVKRILDEE